MQSSNDSKPQDLDAKSVFSMQELDPSPEDGLTPDLESGEFIPTPDENKPNLACGFPAPKIGLRAHRWDALCAFNPVAIGTHCILTTGSIGLSEILHLPSYSVLHPAFGQHFAHPTHDPLRARE